MGKNEVREWINTSIALASLITLVLGVYLGFNELQNVNINLKDLTSDEISTKNIS